jgi:hypothetical protein
MGSLLSGVRQRGYPRTKLITFNGRFRLRKLCRNERSIVVSSIVVSRRPDRWVAVESIQLVPSDGTGSRKHARII